MKGRKPNPKLFDKYAITHDLDSIYRLMVKVFPKISEIKEIAFNRSKSLIPEAVDVLLFDCTTLYFESVDTDELRQFEYTKDLRFNSTRIVLALATNKGGLPIYMSYLKVIKQSLKPFEIVSHDGEKYLL